MPEEIKIIDEFGQTYEILSTQRQTKSAGNTDWDAVVWCETTYTIRKVEKK